MKNKIFGIIVSMVLMIGCCIYVNAEAIIVKLGEFYNESGEKVYYPIANDLDSSNILNNNDDMNGQINAPDTVKIGDVFEGKEGKERVIAINKDGAFVTEEVD